MRILLYKENELRGHITTYDCCLLPAKDSFLSAPHSLPQHEPSGHQPDLRSLGFSCHIQLAECC